MSEMLSNADLPPDQQLAELEDTYAENLMAGTDVQTLAAIWEQIKELRRQLAVPIYEYVTPKALRE